MDMLQRPRKVVTYGKSRRKPNLDSIFDEKPISKSFAVRSASRKEEEHIASPTRKRTPDGKQIVELQHRQSSLVQLSKVSLPPVKGSGYESSESSESTGAGSSQQNQSASSSILDILDSDEEACSRQLQPVEHKRRKITSLKRDSKLGRAAGWENRSNGKCEALREGSQDTGTCDKEGTALRIQRVIKDSVEEGAPISYVNETKIPRQHRSATMRGQRNRLAPSSAVSSRALEISLLKSARTHSKSASVDQQQAIPAPQEALPETPRVRKIAQTENQISKTISSPSQLGLTALRLSPDRRRPPTTLNSDIGFANPRRTTQKLIKRIDAPGREVPLPEVLTGLPNFSPQPLDVHLDGVDRPVSTSSKLARGASLEAHKSPDSVQAAGVRTTTTYAKQRSHLSDMIVEKEGAGDLRASHLASDLVPIASNSSSQQTLEIENRNAGPDIETTVTVRSIHELRQAGSNNRFEIDLETLFEDMEPQSNPSKALRIRALLQLSQKLERVEFSRQFIEVGMVQRLAKCAQMEVDTISGVLLAHAFSDILLDQLNNQQALTAFGAIMSLSTNLLTCNEPFERFVTARKQNLTKSLGRELAEFGAAIKIGSLPQGTPWSPQHVSLFALKSSFMKMKLLRMPPADLPVAASNQILTLLSKACAEDGLTTAQQEVISAGLSVLEFSALSQEDLDHEAYRANVLDYRLLAYIVQKLMDSTTNDDTDLRSTALRLVVSLTNNQPVACTALTDFGLIPAVFAIVKQVLPSLSESADRGDEFDGTKLDTTIMAIGCLLNLSDCSSEARRHMHSSSSSGPSNVQWLVSIFNQRAGKAAEATTIAQSQVLVAFGYMSILLCTLCLDDAIFKHVSETVQGKDLSTLYTEAEDFLAKLETVARLNPNDATTSTFNERLRSILAHLSNRRPT